MMNLFYFACDEAMSAGTEAPAQEPVTEDTAAADKGVDSPETAPQVPEARPAPDTAPQQPEPPCLSNLDWHVTELRRQETELRRLIPDFDLQRELAANPELLRLTAPGSPLTLAEALTTVHLPRLMALREERLVRQTQESLAKTIMSGCYRPPLLTGSAADGPAPMDREKLKERIRSGERVRPG